MKKWWKDPERKKEVQKKISDTLKKKLKGDYSKLPLHLRFRHTLEYRHWRTAVLDRDNYTCQDCSFASSKRKKRRLVQAHHIYFLYKIFQDFDIKTIKEAKKLKILTDVTNGRTLCIPCHKKVHIAAKAQPTD
jgi:hypothetical protein